MGELGERLANLRRASGKSQQEAAHDFGVSVGTWSRWERGTYPRGREIKKLAEFYNVPPDHLVIGSPLEPTVMSPVFHRFIASDLGRVAAARGWVPFLLSAQYPFEPTVKLYKAIVHALMSVEDEDDDPKPPTDHRPERLTVKKRTAS